MTDKMREAVARAIWNIRREEEDRCDRDLVDMGAGHSVWTEADAAIGAMREALVIELPQIVAYEAGYDSLRDNDYASNPDELFDADEVFALHRSIEVQEAIEAAGLKVKP